MSKILFIRTQGEKNFSLNGPPLELLEVAGYLKKSGHETELLDLTVEKKEIDKEFISDFDYILIAYYSLNRVSARQIIKKIKKINAKKIIIAGTVFNNDSHTTTVWEHTMKTVPGIDVCLIGETEETMLDIAKGKPLNEIDGIAFRNGDNIIKNKERNVTDNLDTFGMADWSLVDFSKYHSFLCGTYNGIDLSKQAPVPIRFSRGCIGACKYCALWWVWKKWRTKSGNHMFAEINYLYNNFGRNNFDFRDDCFGADKREVEVLCDNIIKSGIKIAFSVSSRVDILKEESLLKKLKQAGCYRIFYGIETGSQRILDEFNKNIDKGEMIKTLKLVKSLGFELHALMIIGSSAENVESINETIDFLNDVKPDSVSFAGGVMLIPGTAYYQQAKNSGYINDDFWLSNKSYKIDNSKNSQFKNFIFVKAVKERKKIENIKNEYNLNNYFMFGLSNLKSFISANLLK
ncbi:MAG: radical SAM protein [Patescibacteria group bacterium]|nr:radical SAM protein [Patescibacteria group bacterium]